MFNRVACMFGVVLIAALLVTSSQCLAQDQEPPAEAEGLLSDGITPARMAQLGLEYREVTAFLTGEKSEQRMVGDLRHGIRRFAKRQRTWFRGLRRRGIEVTWVDPRERDALLNHPWAADRPQAS